MENLEEIKTGWMPISEAAKVAGISRQNVYYYIKEYEEIRTRYVKARREIRVEDLLKVMGNTKQKADDEQN